LRAAYLCLVALGCAALISVIGVAGPILAGVSSADRLAPEIATLVAAPALRWGSGTALAACLFYVLGHLVPAAIEAVRLGALSGAVRQLASGSPRPESLSELLRKSPLARRAEPAVAGLWNGGGDSNWWATSPSETWLRPAATEREDLAALFGKAGWVALACAAAMAAYGLAPSADPAIARAAALAAIAAAVAGAGILLLSSVVALVQRRRLAQVGAAIDAAFPPITGNTLLTECVRSLRSLGAERDLAVAAAQKAICAEIADGAKEVKGFLGTHDRRVASAVGAAVQRAIEPVGANIAALIERLETDHVEQSRSVLATVLAEFVVEFDRRFAQQASDTGATLAATREAAERLGQQLETLMTASADAHTRHGDELLALLRQGVDEALARQSEAIQEATGRLESATRSLAELFESRAVEQQAAATEWAQRVDDVAQGFVSRGGEELRKAAASFAQLHAILETLCLSVLPGLNKLVDTQERLHAAVSTDRNSLIATAEAATALAESARIARETVERQIVLVRELTRTGQDGPVPPRALAAAAESGALAKALDELRAEADQTRRTLPEL
jgi:hypothetical protein